MSYFRLEFRYGEAYSSVLAVRPAIHGNIYYDADDLMQFLKCPIETFSFIHAYREILKENQMPYTTDMVEHENLLSDLILLNTSRSLFLHSVMKRKKVLQIYGPWYGEKRIKVSKNGILYSEWMEEFRTTIQS